eukprot:4951426-Amphidinium_carterae.3
MSLTKGQGVGSNASLLILHDLQLLSDVVIVQIHDGLKPDGLWSGAVSHATLDLSRQQLVQQYQEPPL